MAMIRCTGGGGGSFPHTDESYNTPYPNNSNYNSGYAYFNTCGCSTADCYYIFYRQNSYLTDGYIRFYGVDDDNNETLLSSYSAAYTADSNYHLLGSYDVSAYSKIKFMYRGQSGSTGNVMAGKVVFS